MISGCFSVRRRRSDAGTSSHSEGPAKSLRSGTTEIAPIRSSAGEPGRTLKRGDRDLNVSAVGWAPAGPTTRECPGKTSVVLQRRAAAPGICFAIQVSGRTRTWSRTGSVSNRGTKARFSPMGRRSVSTCARRRRGAIWRGRHIRFGMRVVASQSSSEEQRWTVEMVRETTGDTSVSPRAFSCGAGRGRW